MTTLILGGATSGTIIRMLQPASMSSGEPMTDFTDIKQDIRELRNSVSNLGSRVTGVETQLQHVATKTWILTGTLFVTVAIIGGFWWVAQQYLAPLLQAAAGH